MFLWEPINDAFEGPFSDGNFDASVVQHEYTHGLSTRYVAGGEALGAQQSGSMGEGWSDWYALNHLYNAGLQSKAVVGEYVTGNPTRGIRNWDYDQNPLGFGDIGYDLTGPEVHADGEIWTATLWNLRKALVVRYGAARGAEVAARIVTDGMPLTAPDPSFLDARDGILAADLDRYHGDDFDTIWTAFAHRGAGASATSRAVRTPIRTRPSTIRPPRATHAGRTFRRRQRRRVANARVIVGDFEARVTPLARTSSTGGFSAKLVAGSYDVTIQAPGYGAQTFTAVAIGAGATKRLTLKVAPNLASKSNGATIVSASSEDPGCRPVPHRRHRGQRLGHPERLHALQRRPGSARDDQARQAGQGHLRRGQRVQDHDRVALPRAARLHPADLDRRRDVDDRADGVVHLAAAAPDGARPAPAHVQARHARPGRLRALLHRLRAGRDADAGAGRRAAGLRHGGDEVTPSPGEPEQPFTDSGTIASGNPTAGDPTGLQNVFGVTGTEFTSNCGSTPASQGADGWVSTLPTGFGDGTHTIAVTGGESTPAGLDLDLYFLDSQCALLGSAATASADESTTIPEGPATCSPSCSRARPCRSR